MDPSSNVSTTTWLVLYGFFADFGVSGLFLVPILCFEAFLSYLLFFKILVDTYSVSVLFVSELKVIDESSILLFINLIGGRVASLVKSKRGWMLRPLRWVGKS